MGLDKELRMMATALQDTTLMSKLSGGDLVAIEAKYHLNCLVAYRNQYRSMQRAASSDDGTTTTDEKILQARAFADLVFHIEGMLENDTYNIFKLSELHELYINRLRELGIEKGINKPS